MIGLISLAAQIALTHADTWTHTVGGARVTLSAISDGAMQKVWSPAGAPVKFSDSVRTYVSKGLGGERFDARYRRIFVRVGPAAEMPTVAFQVGRALVAPAAGTLLEQAHTWVVLGDANTRESAVRVRVGIGTGVWKTIGKLNQGRTGNATRDGFGFVRSIRPWEAVHNHSKSELTIADVMIPPATEATTYRVVAFDRNGKSMTASGTMREPNGLTHAYFAGKYANLARLELQTRPFLWTVFDHVKLN